MLVKVLTQFSHLGQFSLLTINNTQGLHPGRHSLPKQLYMLASLRDKCNHHKALCMQDSLLDKCSLHKLCLMLIQVCLQDLHPPPRPLRVCLDLALCNPRRAFPSPILPHHLDLLPFPIRPSHLGKCNRPTVVQVIV